ncbi:helix-turn-helix domain-containing protein [bacterium]|nr:helix-turn-helix domain-containing protein [bacterium]
MATALQYEHATVFGAGGFPLAVCRHLSLGPAVKQHRHTFHELVLVLGGQGWHAVGEEKYPLMSGDVFVVLGDTAHGYPETDRLSLVNILYDPATLGFPLADVGSLPGYHALFTLEPQMPQKKFRSRLRLGVEQLARAVELVARLEAELVQAQRGYGFVAIAQMMRLIGHLSRCYSELEAPPQRPLAQLSEVLGYMERHLPEPMTVVGLARVAHMSQTSLTRNFRQMLGRSPIDYLIGLRLSRAQVLLQGTDLSVTEIAFRVGFGDSNYFSRQFRKTMGMTPSDFRHRHRCTAQHAP